MVAYNVRQMFILLHSAAFENPLTYTNGFRIEVKHAKYVLHGLQPLFALACRPLENH